MSLPPQGAGIIPVKSRLTLDFSVGYNDDMSYIHCG